MIKLKKWSYESVVQFIGSNSECKLLDNNFKSTKHKMKFLCKCGREFSTTFEAFRLRNKRQCNDCGKEICKTKHIKLSFKDVENFIENESESGCKLLSNSFNGIKKPLKIQCKCGNEFETTFEKFRDRNKRQCNDCGYNNIKEHFTYTYNEVLSYIQNESKCKLISKEYNGIESEIILECECGRKFTTTLKNFKQKKSKMCNYCSNLFSEGETIIEDYFTQLGIKVKTQYTFEDLKSINNRQKLRFDIAMFNKNNKLECLIEYDGKQHFEPIEYFGGEKEFKKVKNRDKIKNDYCKKNNIKLIRIAYFDKEKIMDILQEEIKLDKLIPSQALTI